MPTGNGGASTNHPKAAPTSLRRGALKRVEERPGLPDFGPFVRDGDGHDANLIVVRKSQRPRAGRKLDDVGEEVRVGVGVARAGGGVSVRGEPGQRGLLDEARPDAGHLCVRVWAATLAYACGRLGRRARRHLPSALPPLPRVPLADEAAPILNL